MFSALFSGYETHTRRPILNIRSVFLTFIILTLFCIVAFMMLAYSPKVGLLSHHPVSFAIQQQNNLLQPSTTITTSIQPTNLPLTTPSLTLTSIDPIMGTALPTVTNPHTPAVTATLTFTVSSTATTVQTSTATVIQTSTYTFTYTPTPFGSPTLALTSIETLTQTVIPTLAKTPTATSVLSTVIPTLTPSSTTHLAPTITPSPLPTWTNTPTEAPLPTAVPTITPLPTTTEMATSVMMQAETVTAVPISTTHSSTPSPTLIVTTTETSLPTITPTTTPLPNMTARPSSTPIASATPIEVVDTSPCPGQECNEGCAAAPTIPTDGTIQSQQFVGSDRTDWFLFDVEPNVNYLIEASALPGSETAVLRVEFYNDCDLAPQASQKITFTHDIRLNYISQQKDTLYLKITDIDTNTEELWPYNLSIYAMDAQLKPGAVIILGSHLKDHAEQQAKINNLARRFYSLYANSYPKERIKLFIEGVEESENYSESPTKEDLKEAITTWAATLVGKQQPLTLYLVGYSQQDSFYIDESNEEWLAPNELNDWLEQLEDSVPEEIDINIIIEASYSGSFITGENNISKLNRMIITSAEDNSQAYATEDGAIFSDFFMDTVENGATVFHSYNTGYWAANVTRYWQKPGIDANGNRVPNEVEDYVISSRRGLLYDLPQGLSPLTDTPFFVQIDDPEAPRIVNLNGTKYESNECFIQAMVQDNKDAVKRVWAQIYEPGFKMPDPSASLAVDTTIGITMTELSTQTVHITNTHQSLEATANVTSTHEASETQGMTDDSDTASPNNAKDNPLVEDLRDIGGGLYLYRHNCTRKGTYRFVIHAEDHDGKLAKPASRSLINPQFLYLPVIWK